MRVRILSDLHREFGPTEIPPRGDCDLIVLAGDIATRTNALPWIREFCGDTPTAYICGNHEFYGARWPAVIEKLQEETRDTAIHVLEDDHFTCQGWHIYGCTLWTDLELLGDPRDCALEVQEQMNDYRKIRNSRRAYRKLTPRDTRAAHLASRQKLQLFLETHDPQRTIVVTHHAPSALSLPESRRHQLLSGAYASALDDFILQHQPALWIHGHIHWARDYRIGATRIVANPQGYPGQGGRGFDPGLLLELELPEPPEPGV